MPGPTVAIACCRRSGDARPDDLYPDPDAAPLRSALASMGVSSALVAWDDPGADWASFSRVLVSSTWDSVDRPAEYLAWARRVDAATTLVNPAVVIDWGLDKVHQRQLAEARVPVVPTTWVGPGSEWPSPPEGDFVVKPSVSAGGRSTAIYAGADPRAVAHVRGLQALGQTVMVQDYLLGVESQGETDLIFFDGAFSHAVAKKAFLHRGEGVIERPWERMSWAGLTTPRPAQVDVAKRALGFISDRLGCRLTYARFDLVDGHDGEPLVLEVELVDPYLSLEREPRAAGRLALALMTSAGGGPPGGAGRLSPDFGGTREPRRPVSDVGSAGSEVAEP